MGKRKTVSMIGLLVLAGLTAWIFRPYPKIDESQVHPLLRGLDENAKCDWTSYGDGGSVAILITRPDGSEVDCCLAKALDNTVSERGQLYVGASYFSMPGSVRITGYDHSKFVVAKLLARDLSKGPYPDLREDIALLTGRWSDWISFGIHLPLDYLRSWVVPSSSADTAL